MAPMERIEHHFGPFWEKDFGAISGGPFFSRPLCFTSPIAKEGHFSEQISREVCRESSKRVTCNGGVRCERFDRTLRVVLQTLSLGGLQHFELPRFAAISNRTIRAALQTTVRIVAKALLFSLLI